MIPGKTNIQDGYINTDALREKLLNRQKLQQTTPQQGQPTVQQPFNQTSQIVNQTAGKINYYRPNPEQQQTQQTTGQQASQVPVSQSNTDYVNSQTANINNMYDKLKAAQQAQVAAQRDKQIEGLRRQLADQLPQYQTQRAQADVGQEQNMNRLREYMAGQGAFNSGDNLSRASNIMTNRANAVNQINGNENAYTISNQNAMNDAESAYNAAVNQYNAQYDAQKAQALMDLASKMRDEDMQSKRDAQAQSNWQNQFDYTKTRDTSNDAFRDKQFDYNKNIDDRNYNFDREKYATAINEWLAQNDLQNRQFDYQKYADDRNYNFDREKFNNSNNQWQQQFDYQKGRDNVADNRWQTQFDYQKGRDSVGDSQWQQTFNLNKSNADRNYALQQAQAARASSGRSSSGVSNSMSVNSAYNKGVSSVNDIVNGNYNLSEKQRVLQSYMSDLKSQGGSQAAALYNYASQALNAVNQQMSDYVNSGRYAGYENRRM